MIRAPVRGAVGSPCNGRGDQETGGSGSRPVSRVLSKAAIHLGRASPRASSDLPGSGAGHAGRSPIWSCSGWGLPCHRCCHRRGALLPHLFTLARAWRAVCFLWHFPWARAPQALPGTLPCGARTFLPAAMSGAAAARPTPARLVSAHPLRSATAGRNISPMFAACSKGSARSSDVGAESARCQCGNIGDVSAPMVARTERRARRSPGPTRQVRSHPVARAPSTHHRVCSLVRPVHETALQT